MKQKVLLLVISSSFFFQSFSQENSQAFAITGQPTNNINWTDIRTIDMATGNIKSTLFENGKTKFSFVDADTKQTVNQFFFFFYPDNFQQNNLSTTSDKIIIKNPSPTSFMSAAVAYDKTHNKLFFASMYTGRLMWLDLGNNNSTPSFYTIQQPLLNEIDSKDDALNITRMTIGADGNGYALSNDGNHLIKFTTGNKVVITDMGSLIDDDTNKGISVHDQSGNWGGDVVADAFGKLYLFGAGRSVFVIDPQTRVATYKGSISGLSVTFSVNGAAAIDDNNVIISSANTFEGFYKVDINKLTAEKINTQGTVYNASDLASGNLLHLQEKISGLGESQLADIAVIGNRFISVYPNPVSDGKVKITFDGNATGTYKISVNDLQGRLIGIKNVFVKGHGQLENFQFRTKPTAGLYMIKITDASNKSIFSDKLIVE